MLSNKAPQHKVRNVTGALKPFKPYFAWHIKQSVAANTISRSLYSMNQPSHCQSNLVTTPSSCILLTLQSVLNQNLTCQPPSSSCRIPMTLDTLKTELKPPFIVNITKNPLLHADKNGEHSCGENLHNGSENGLGSHLSGEFAWQ